MTDADLFPFMETFRGLARVFPLKGDDHEIKQTAGAYFKVLRRYPLPLVQAGADVCLQRAKHFPKPAEWIDAVPQAREVVELQTMTDAQAREYAHAEQNKWQGDPCSCAECAAAHVDWKPIRFVPESTSDDRDRKMRDPLKDRIVTMGHWAHGRELERWYAAKAKYYAAFQAMVDKHKMPRGLPKDHARKDEAKANRIRQQAAAMTAEPVS